MSEIEAMSAIDKAVGALEPDEQKRVLRWAVDKFGGGQVKIGTPAGGGDGGAAGMGNGSRDDGAGSCARISDLMDAARPTTVVDHVHVASYWFQVVRGQELHEPGGQLRTEGSRARLEQHHRCL